MRLTAALLCFCCVQLLAGPEPVTYLIEDDEAFKAHLDSYFTQIEVEPEQIDESKDKA